jgi:tetratricopeptide (TPR) repeat protein
MILAKVISCYQRFPDQVVQDEEASLMVARGLLASGRTQEAAKLRDSWNGREKQEENWLCYDADEALRRDKVEEAIQILKSKSFSGTVDIGRLLRLAMLNARNPPEAIANLQAAYAADPKNLDVRSFRGQILERGARGLARVEYEAAVLAAQENPLMRDQLAEFYLRQQNYADAVQTMEEALQTRARLYVGEGVVLDEDHVAFPDGTQRQSSPGRALAALDRFHVAIACS